MPIGLRHQRSWVKCVGAGLLLTIALGAPALALEPGPTPARTGTPAVTAPNGLEGSPSLKKASPSIRVEIDVLPGETENLVDPAVGGTIPVAILGDAAFDAASVDPATVVLGRASVMKQVDGSLGILEDVNHDGRPDLVVFVEAGRLWVDENRSDIELRARTFHGHRVRGSDSIQSVRGLVAHASAMRTAPSKEKLPPIPVEFVVLPAQDDAPSGPAGISARLASASPAAPSVLPLAVLGSPDLDVRTIEAATLHLGGARVTKGSDGRLASYTDVNGDGREDLVVLIPRGALRAAASDSSTVRGLTTEGRFLQGSLAQSLAGEPRLAVPTAEELSQENATWNGDGVPLADGNDPPVVEYTNSSAITIPNGAASPYPSTINVSALTGVVVGARVTLRNLTHSYLGDLDILLVGPTGQNIVLMSDVGGINPGASNVTLTFDDRAFGTLDVATIPTSGSYVPANSGAGDPFPGPAPAPMAAPLLSAFRGTDPNGAWRLYVVDDASGDTGAIAGGWTLDLMLGTEFCNSGPITIPAGAPGTTSGPASPYSSDIEVSGVNSAVLSKITVTLKDFSHTFPGDVDVVLQNPNNVSIMLMSDAGGGTDVNDLTLVLDDAGLLPLSGTFLDSRVWIPGDLEPGESLPAPAPPAGPGFVSTLDSFVPMDPNGTWRLWVADDDTSDVGSIAGGWCVTVTNVAPVNDCNSGAITIPAGAPGTTIGPASPYPSTVTIAGVTGVIWDVSVTLNRVNHSFPDDLDILLVTPTGQKIMLMSDTGGSNSITNLGLTFNDAGPLLSDSGAISSGTYHPTDFLPGESLPAPAPAGPYGTSLAAALSGTNPNGTWSLYVSDDTGGNVGSILGGWCPTLTLYLAPGGICDGFPITIPAGAPGTTSGPASPYPATMLVSTDFTRLRKVRVRLQGLTHTAPEDLDILLQAPGGATVLLMSDAGGAVDANNVDLVFDPDAPALLPANGLIVSGSYKPTDFAPADTFPAPAPAGPYTTSMNALTSTNPNGTWKLFINDDAGTDVGSIANGWCLFISPDFPPGEVPNLRWRPGSKTILEWDPAPNASEYRVYRGVPSALPQLLVNGVDDSCRDALSITFVGSTTAVPPVGSMYWYLVVASNVTGDQGPAGRALIGSTLTAEVLNFPAGSCP